MADNKKLQNAKAVKNDEFYTEYSTISNEMGHYRDQFRNQVVYCNCDDPTWSNFWKYFHNNFASLGLRKLISTHYQKDTDPSYAMIYEGGDDFNMDVGKIIEIKGNTAVVNGKEVFYNAGDFRSEACLKLMEEATIVSSNPPFSLFREYLKLLVDSSKKFIILGNQNASTCKEVFPLIKENKVWYGASIHSGGVDFRIPDNYEAYSSNVFIKNGHHYINLSGIRWFTNMDVKYRHDGLWHKNGQFDNSQAHCYYEGNEIFYPICDNYNIINVSVTKNIPIDYQNVMGVPITWLDKYSPTEFRIIGITASWDENQEIAALKTSSNHRHNPIVGGKEIYRRILVQNLSPIKRSEDLGY